MATIQRYRVAWTGFIGGPGVSTFYAASGSDLMSPLQAFFTSIAIGLPTGVTIQVSGTQDLLEDTTGAATGVDSIANPPEIHGADPASYPAPTGAVVDWLTSTYSDRRRLRGRTFLVPLGGGSYQADGSINSTNLTNIRAAAVTFLASASPGLLVWRRPRAAVPADGSRPAVTFRAGSSAVVTSVGVADKAAVLRSRRD